MPIDSSVHVEKTAIHKSQTSKGQFKWTITHELGKITGILSSGQLAPDTEEYSLQAVAKKTGYHCDTLFLSRHDMEELRDLLNHVLHTEK